MLRPFQKKQRWKIWYWTKFHRFNNKLNTMAPWTMWKRQKLKWRWLKCLSCSRKWCRIPDIFHILEWHLQSLAFWTDCPASEPHFSIKYSEETSHQLALRAQSPRISDPTRDAGLSLCVLLLLEDLPLPTHRSMPWFAQRPEAGREVLCSTPRGRFLEVAVVHPVRRRVRGEDLMNSLKHDLSNWLFVFYPRCGCRLSPHPPWRHCMWHPLLLIEWPFIDLVAPHRVLSDESTEIWYHDQARDVSHWSIKYIENA